MNVQQQEDWQPQAREYVAQLLQQEGFAGLPWLRLTLTGVYQAAQQAGQEDLAAVAMACLGALHKWEKQQKEGAKAKSGRRRVRCRIRGASGKESAAVLELSPELLRTAEEIESQ